MFDQEFILAVKSYEEGRLEESLYSFHSLLKECPFEEDEYLSQIFSYLGHILLDFGMDRQALSSLKKSLRASSCDSIKKEVLSLINSYGMIRNNNSFEDDFKAFISIQIKKYLEIKHQHRFGSKAEADMVMELLLDAWDEIKPLTTSMHSNLLNKLKVFKGYKIDFPIMSVNESTVIVFNFTTKRVQKREDECICGSGLPYYACCGSVKEPKDYFLGLK